MKRPLGGTLGNQGQTKPDRSNKSVTDVTTPCGYGRNLVVKRLYICPPTGEVRQRPGKTGELTQACASLGNDPVIHSAVAVALAVAAIKLSVQCSYNAS